MRCMHGLTLVQGEGTEVERKSYNRDLVGGLNLHVIM